MLFLMQGSGFQIVLPGVFWISELFELVSCNFSMKPHLTLFNVSMSHKVCSDLQRFRLMIFELLMSIVQSHCNAS